MVIMGYGRCLSFIFHFKSSLKQISNCYRFFSATPEWEPVVGLEIHAQIQSSSKLFSGADTNFQTPTNRSVALFDAAFPGTLPVLNRRCVEAGTLTALALSCDLNQVSTFDRKHYFYSDLPAGYQITQHRFPLAQNGLLNFIVYKGGSDSRLYEKTSQIHQIQLEQDSGRSLHDEIRSLVDLNRAGLPLMELVFKPDLSDGEEAAALVKELILVLTRLGTCSCKMEEGALRVDANVSVHRRNSPLGTRTEIKNIGAIRAVANAVDYEIDRQIRVLQCGKEVVNETRSWDAERMRTVPMRDKEEKQDYRYMPEPNLPPLHLRLTNDQPMHSNMVDVTQLINKVPESPFQMRVRFQKDYGLSLLQAVRLVSEDMLLPLFFNAMNMKQDRDAVILTDLLLNDVLSYFNEDDSCNVVFKADDMGTITDMMKDGVISKSIARIILKELSQSPALSAKEVMEKNNLSLICDPAIIERLCRSVTQENANMLKKHLAGKKDSTKVLETKVWKKSEGRANMNLVKEWFKTNYPFSKK
ncbi:glutamyl-tRNA(Gln) amidotransferase subunit B, mitochondrial [Thrips palmi]|uniref:Glutamyl-tRNA(Gln) amidotransferase subunit B, mitochondrial n=1 Tax=Thrips palmi TaxID=161013 RepID=A0A6P8ZHV2_THRPL|nr:glutamyl-tRNA(Gln) amidotransferase subunit B, mitochondrial [Thrips palmi]